MGIDEHRFFDLLPSYMRADHCYFAFKLTNFLSDLSQMLKRLRLGVLCSLTSCYRSLVDLCLKQNSCIRLF